MADYPIQGGLFLQVCSELINADFRISWYDRFGAHEPLSANDHPAAAFVSELPEAAMSVAASSGLSLLPMSAKPGAVTNRSNRSKYACACKPRINVWGKPGLDLNCNACYSRFEELVSTGDDDAGTDATS